MGIFENKIYFVAVMILLLSSCGSSNDNNDYDEKFIPYGIRAFEVWVYNNKTDKEYYAGRIDTNYFYATEDLSNAQSLAYDYAEAKHLKDWSYICCTVTNFSNCATKVK